MPNFLKSILGSRTSRSPRSRRTSSSPSHPVDRSIDLTSLTADLARTLHETQSRNVAGASSSSSGERLQGKSSRPRSRSLFGSSKTKNSGNFQSKLHDAVQAIEAVGRVDPYPRPSTNQPQVAQHAIPIVNQAAASSSLPPTALPPPAGNEWSEALQCVNLALDEAQQALSATTSKVQTNQVPLTRCMRLLAEHNEALAAMQPWAEDKPLTALHTLTQVYNEIVHAFEQVTADPSGAKTGLRTVLQVLREGPDYLIDIALIDCMIWQAEVIDPSFGEKIRISLNNAVGAQLSLEDFRKQIPDILDIALSPPADAINDDLSRDALNAIRQIAEQLRDRLKPKRPISLAATVQSSASSASSNSQSVSISSAPSSPSSSPADYTPHNAQTLQSVYGTGPLPPGASSYFSPRPPAPRATPSPSPPPTPNSQKSIFEYRGHRMTRSALELVQTQERLAMADSSGQYAGEVSFDDLRNAWIPKWAEKLRAVDVAEGEIPDTNPANYREKKRDAWGNKIGWYEGRM